MGKPNTIIHHKLGPSAPTQAPSPKMSMGKPKAIKAFTNLGFSFRHNPLKSKSILIFSLGPLQPHTLLLHLWRRRRRKWRRERHCRRSSELVQAANFPSHRLDYRHPCHVRRRVPTSASGSGASSCGLVSASGSGASNRGLVSASEDASSVEPGRLGESLPRASSTMLLPPSSYSGRAG